MAWADGEVEWQTLSEEVYSGMADWRAAPPRARFAEIEAAVEERRAALPRYRPDRRQHLRDTCYIAARGA